MGEVLGRSSASVLPSSLLSSPHLSYTHLLTLLLVVSQVLQRAVPKPKQKGSRGSRGARIAARLLLTRTSKHIKLLRIPEDSANSVSKEQVAKPYVTEFLGV